MNHLKDSELVDLVESTLPEARRAHVDSCEDCRGRAATLTDLRSRISDAAIPEPSPLFWDHFSARVSTAINQPVNERWLVGRWRLISFAAGLAVAILLIISMWQATGPERGNVATTTAAREPAPAGSVAQPSGLASKAEALDDVEADQAWALVRAVADDVPWDETSDAGVSAHPGSAERAVMELNERERAELARLLKDALRHRGA